MLAYSPPVLPCPQRVASSPVWMPTRPLHAWRIKSFKSVEVQSCGQRCVCVTGPQRLWFCLCGSSLRCCWDAFSQTPRTVGVFNKLTNADLYTGSHREKFQEISAGYGGHLIPLTGFCLCHCRSRAVSGVAVTTSAHLDKVIDLSQITRTNLNNGSTLLSPAARGVRSPISPITCVPPSHGM